MSVALVILSLAVNGIDVPDLGTKRRVVMSDMRVAGLALLDSSGDRLDFLGGPKGLEEATTTSFQFDDLELHEIRMSFPRLDTQSATTTLYRQLHKRLSQQYGRPQVDGLRSRTSGGSVVSTWGNDGATLTLHADRHRDVTLVVALASVNGPPARRVFRNSEDAGLGAWSREQFQKRVTDAKRATDELLDDFDKQRFMTWARQKKRGPINVRLKNVTVPSGAGLDRELFITRFAYFVRGSTDLVLASRRADIEVEILVKPTHVGGGRSLDVVLVARAMRGKARNRVLFTKAVTVY